MPGLRERRHEETKRHLVAVAFELFADRGFAQVTMEEVARAAGVSRSTAYRRFPTKEDVVLEVPRRWLDAFDTAAAGLAPDAPVGDAVAATTMAVAQHIDEHRDTVRTAYDILAGSPHLQQSGVATTAWIERMSALVRRFSDLDVEAASTIAGAYLGGIDAMMQQWAERGGSGSVADMTQRLLDRLAPMLTGAE